MTTRLTKLWFWLYASAVTVLVVGAVKKDEGPIEIWQYKPAPAPRINWLNDSVYYSTNQWAGDEERNKTRTTNELAFYYLKSVVSMNKVLPLILRAGDRDIELGARDDGVIVWRHLK